MEFHQLRSLNSFAEEGTFRPAAIKCHLTQLSLNSPLTPWGKGMPGR
jgi:DNA-binding transcriptional LysR family regulator